LIGSVVAVKRYNGNKAKSATENEVNSSAHKEDNGGRYERQDGRDVRDQLLERGNYNSTKDDHRSRLAQREQNRAQEGRWNSRQ
jgi:hypothetical protein